MHHSLGMKLYSRLRKLRRRQLTPPERRGEEKDKISKHPLLIVAVTFILSGVLGTAFSQWLSIQAKETERIRVAAEARKTAVQNFSRFVYERRARAEMLASSFKRNAPIDEIKSRKLLYDDAYVKWNSYHQSNLFLIRDILQSEDYTFFESVVEFNLVGEIFKPLDYCLTRAYDTRLHGGDIDTTLKNEKCNLRRLLQEALDCGYAITDELYQLSAGNKAVIQSAREIKARCPENAQNIFTKFSATPELR